MGPLMPTWPLLFGQAVQMIEVGSGQSGAPNALLLLPIAGLAAVLLAIGLPIVLGFRSGRRRREMEHAERMRAIELGRPIPGEGGRWTPARVAVGIGAGVPIGVFGIGWIAALTSGAAPFIWPSAGAVGVAAVICGTVLAARLPAPRPYAPDPLAKPHVDPDAYDVAEHQHS